GDGQVSHSRSRQAPPPLARAAVADLTVATETREGYKRTSFKRWVDADGDACNARQEVLIAEAVDTPRSARNAPWPGASGIRTRTIKS
ncbi:hypothetical protein PW035_63740, partial [Nonomuraea angiospora]|nr:hypothetical protein [Nonomuraea angiospora]